MASSKDKPRGAAGKFISEEKAKNLTEADLPELVNKSSEMTGGLKDVKESLEDKEFDKPLVSVSVNNPVSWFMKLLNHLKKKQTTTITFRLGIPLIALPIFIAAFAGLFFGLGKITTTPEEKIVEKQVESYQMSRAGHLKIIKNGDIRTYYLILPDGEAIKLDIPENFNISSLDGKRVLVSGIYYTKELVLKVDNVADMEILPLSPSPIPSPLPTATPTPIPNS